MAGPKRLAVLDVVGLTSGGIGANTPRIEGYRRAGVAVPIQPAFPAVTCTAQSTYLTGRQPTEHGIVGNGWYHRELAEVQFWKQSNHLVRAPKLWERLRAGTPGFTCAKLFWWYNMYATVDYSITPRPLYPADGRKVFDIYTWPYSIRPAIKHDLGEFPFAGFWGPAAGRDTPQGSADCVTKWIAEAARWIERRHRPTLSLVYLPHLDYNLQRYGPQAGSVARDYREIDAIVGGLLDFYQEREVEVVLLSEYGLTPVYTPVHLNRVLRQQGWLTVKEELGRELLDAGASRAFAVADHQVGHVYVRNPADVEAVKQLLSSVPGVAQVLDAEAKREWGLDHERAGDLVALAAERAWFTYYYWDDDARAPDFARTVDIHRKPGYDPTELFLNPALPGVRARILWRLLQKKLGFRMLMDVIPLDASLVRGSHGTVPPHQTDWPVLVTPRSDLVTESTLAATGVHDLLMQHLQPCARHTEQGDAGRGLA